MPRDHSEPRAAPGGPGRPPEGGARRPLGPWTWPPTFPAAAAAAPGSRVHRRCGQRCARSPPGSRGEAGARSFLQLGFRPGADPSRRAARKTESPAHSGAFSKEPCPRPPSGPSLRRTTLPSHSREPILSAAPFLHLTPPPRGAPRQHSPQPRPWGGAPARARGGRPRPTCLTELPQGLRQARRLRGRLLRRPRGPPLAPRPFRAIPGGLGAPQGHGQTVPTANTGGRPSRGQRRARVLPGSQWEPQNTSLRNIQNGGGGGGGGKLPVLPPRVLVDGRQSPPQARSPTVCLQREKEWGWVSRNWTPGEGVGGEAATWKISGTPPRLCSCTI